MSITAIQESIGQGAQQRVALVRETKREAEINGEIKPATLLNLSPFDLNLGSGLISYTIPKCPDDKKFFAFTQEVALFPTYFARNEETSDGVVKKFGCKRVYPIHQLMEFRLFYCGQGEEEGLKQGGVIVFEGTMEGIKPDSIVKTPRYMIEGKKRYLVFDNARLGDLIAREEENLRQKCLRSLQQSQRWADKGGIQVNNIQNAEHVWADYAVKKKIIQEAPKWRHVSIETAQQCKKCAKQYKSSVGVCECGYVQQPLVAYLAGEIRADHVRLETLSKEDWAKVTAEETRREKLRA